MAKWRWYNRGTIYPHRADIVQRGVVKFAKYNLTPITTDLYINAGTKLWWAWDDVEITRLGQAILKKCNSKKSAQQHIIKLEKILRRAIKYADNFKEKDLSLLNNKELSKQYDLIYKHSLEAHGITNDDIDGFDIVFDVFLFNLISNYIKNKPAALASAFKILSNTTYQSYLSQLEYRASCLIVKRVRSEDIANILHKEYWWASMGWENMTPHSKKYFFNYTKRMTVKKAKSIVRQFNDKFKLVTKDRRLIIKKYHLPKSLNHWLGVLDKYAYLHDYRKEMQVKTNYACHRILLETAKRYKIKPLDLEWLFHNEIKLILTGKKINRMLVKKRRLCVTSMIIKSRATIKQGRAAQKIKEQNLNLDKLKSNEVKGLSVTSGVAKGRALVCQGAKEAIKKIKTGDILICPMTMPDYLPAMKKAKAIVTDEGGLTSHASIIARELKKVCVVGTKDATRIFKTGDRIIVDANNGLVRKVI